jgi:hypothetical protein
MRSSVCVGGGRSGSVEGPGFPFKVPCVRKRQPALPVSQAVL